MIAIISSDMTFYHLISAELDHKGHWSEITYNSHQHSDSELTNN